MKLTKQQLKQIVKEEMTTLANEGVLDALAGGLGGARHAWSKRKQGPDPEEFNRPLPDPGDDDYTLPLDYRPDPRAEEIRQAISRRKLEKEKEASARQVQKAAGEEIEKARKEREFELGKQGKMLNSRGRVVRIADVIEAEEATKAREKFERSRAQDRQRQRDIEIGQGIANPRGGSVRDPEAEKEWDRRWGAGTMRRTPGWADVSENKIKLTKQQLKEIIKEELVHVIAEITGFEPSPEMEVMKHYQALLDALEDSDHAEWAEVLSKLRPELEHDLDVEARGDEDVFTNAPKDYASMEEQKLTKGQIKRIVVEELASITSEAWKGDPEINQTGEYADKTKEELCKTRDNLKKKEDRTEAESTKLRQLNFAIRSKKPGKKFGKVDC